MVKFAPKQQYPHVKEIEITPTETSLQMEELFSFRCSFDHWCTLDSEQGSILLQARLAASNKPNVQNDP